jgi:outer membrane biosynthesis protein TonB
MYIVRCLFVRAPMAHKKASCRSHFEPMPTKPKQHNQPTQIYIQPTQPKHPNQPNQPINQTNQTKPSKPNKPTNQPTTPNQTTPSHTKPVDISPSSQPDRSLSALSYGLKPNCNLSQSRQGHIPIACAHTTGNSNTHLRQVSYKNLLRSQYTQGCNQCKPTHKFTSIVMLANCIPMHPTSILV